jgi:hypothetical protein
MFFGGTGNRRAALRRSRGPQFRWARELPRSCARENGSEMEGRNQLNSRIISAPLLTRDIVNATGSNHDSTQTIHGTNVRCRRSERILAGPRGEVSTSLPADCSTCVERIGAMRTRRLPDGMRSLHPPQLRGMAADRITPVPIGQSADVPSDRWDRWRLIAYPPRVRRRAFRQFDALLRHSSQRRPRPHPCHRRLAINPLISAVHGLGHFLTRE